LGLDRAAGQQRPQPSGFGERGGQPVAVALGDRRGDGYPDWLVWHDDSP
jgi:hypothetical protein